MSNKLEWSPTAPPPSVIGVEVSTICNMRCVICSLTRAGGKVNRPAYPDDALIGKLLPYMRQAQVLRLIGLGEPLISPAFWTILGELAHGEHPKHIETNTNGQMLDDQRISRILDSPLSHISFSLDAARPETYRRLRGADLQKLLVKIAALIAERDRRQKTLHVQLNATIMRENIEELPELLELVHTLKADSIRYWELAGSDCGDTGRNTECSEWQFSFSSQKLNSFPEIRERYVALTKSKAREYGIPIDSGRFDLMGLDYWFKHHVKCAPSICYFPMVWLDVLSNGQSRFCCYGHPIGNLTETPVNEIWNGAMAQETRSLLSQDRIPASCCGAECPYVQGPNAGGATEPAKNH